MSTLFYFVTSFLDYLVANPHTRIKAKVLASFLPQIAIKRAVVTIMQFETQRRQLTMGNLGETIHNYNLGIAYTMMLFSTVVFSIVGIYLTQILATSGMRKHPCFCLGVQRKQVKLDES